MTKNESDPPDKLQTMSTLERLNLQSNQGAQAQSTVLQRQTTLAKNKNELQLLKRENQMMQRQVDNYQKVINDLKVQVKEYQKQSEYKPICESVLNTLYEI